MTPFILVSCLSAVENVNRAVQGPTAQIKAPSQRPKHAGIVEKRHHCWKYFCLTFLSADFHHGAERK